MKAFYQDQFILPLPADHRFPVAKYASLRERALAEGILAPGDLLVPEAATEMELLRVHSSAYLERVLHGTLTEGEIRRLGFPWSPQLVERSRRSVGGTISACRAALLEGLAVNLAGGTHHAHTDFGSGYCLFNDVAVAARAAQAEGLTRRVAILDCDVHQGDGTAAIFRQDPSIFTFSIHAAKNFPFHKEPSDLDLPLEDGCTDAAYLEALEQGLLVALPRAEADLAIYLAGADPYRDDRLGRLALSKAGLEARDRLVLEYCGRYGLPAAIVMAGGYGRCVDDTVDIHLQTVRQAAQVAGRLSLSSLKAQYEG